MILLNFLIPNTRSLRATLLPHTELSPPILHFLRLSACKWIIQSEIMDERYGTVEKTLKLESEDLRSQL